MNSDYLLDRIYKGLGMTDDLNNFRYKNKNGDFYTDKIIKANQTGDLIITPFDLERKTYIVEQTRVSNIETYTDTSTWVYTRFTPEKQARTNKKSFVPKEMTPPPFITPNILDVSEIDTLYITEGYIKAIKLYIDGCYAIGLNGIQCYKDAAKSGGLHKAIYDILKLKNAKKVCVCYDADCRNFSEKHLENNQDLTSKLMDFYRSYLNISKLLKVYNSELTVMFVANKDKTYKGIDDLLCAKPEAINELTRFDILDGEYFFKEFNDFKVKSFLMLNDIDTFFNFNKNKLNGYSFIYNKQSYICENFELKKVEKQTQKVPFIRVGNDFFELIENNEEIEFHKRKRETLKDDYGKEYHEMCRKYVAFTNEPCNTNEYQLIINDKYVNSYKKVNHKYLEGSFETIKQLLNHLFKGEVNGISKYEIGLDYLQLLFFKPKQILPILCLVSTENVTGKSTFLNFLKAVFKSNMVVLGNKDFESSWNDAYADKLICAIDESKIESDAIMNKIKSLSTAKTILLNRRFCDQITIPFFGKWILCSNYEDNFALLSENDVRFWIEKINKIPFEFDPFFEEKVINEVPYFLYYLQNRNLVTKNENRHWFSNDLIRTEQLEKVINNSKGGLYNDLYDRLSTIFLNDENLDKIEYTLSNIKDLFYPNNGKYQTSNIKHCLTNHFKLKNTTLKKYTLYSPEYKLIKIDSTGRVFTFTREMFINEEIKEKTSVIECPY